MITLTPQVAQNLTNVVQTQYDAAVAAESQADSDVANCQTQLNNALIEQSDCQKDTASLATTLAALSQSGVVPTIQAEQSS